MRPRSASITDGAWDGHLLLLYSCQAERVAGLAAWAKRGLLRGERVLIEECRSRVEGAGAGSWAAMLTLLGRDGVDTARAVSDGRLVMRPDRWSCRDVGSAFGPAFGPAYTGGSGGVRVAVQSDLDGARGSVPERWFDEACVSHSVSVLCQLARSAGDQALASGVRLHVGGLRDPLLQTRRALVGTAIEGEVDASNVAVFSALVEALTHGHEPIVWLDVRELRYCDGVGAQALLDASHEYRRDGGRLRLVAPTPLVSRVLTMLEVDRARGIGVLRRTSAAA